ncbi:SMI1/KNR4 family protein [Streptomyces sp. NPDC004126]|uniref:SMI1/KNR4 family protein n=1 Tax=Streptomyces sp. NPDC004126 TaxID=3390695 RepID=UPI003CFDEFBA
MNETEQLLEQVADRVRASARERGKPLPAPLPADEAERAAQALGFALPPLLTALYTRIGDGGFGPEYGLLPLRQSIRKYEAGRASDWGRPEGVLPIADLGCAMSACVDCRSDTAQMLLFEPNPGERDLAWYHKSAGLADWLRDWLDGTGWFRDEEEWGEEDDGDETEMTPWAEFSSRCAA